MNLEDLGRRAVACKHWRWMPGMAVLCISYDQEGFYTSVDRETGKTVIEPFVKGELRTAGPFRMVTEKDLYDGEEVLPVIKRISVPNLSDPATLGCLLALVQEAWNACRISVCFSAYTPDATKRWSVPISFFRDQRDLVHVPSFYGTTQAEALVAALEAAP